jgi:hypothetical protein
VTRPVCDAARPFVGACTEDAYTGIGARADTRSVVRNDRTWQQQSARGAVLALHQALAVRRQHPDHPALWRAAMRHCRQAVAAATRTAPLVVQLRDGRVHAADEALFPFAPGDLPFGPLRAAGVGAVELAAGIADPAIDALVERLLTVSDHPDPEQSVAGLFAAPQLASVQFRVTSGDDAANPHHDWALVLPAPPPPPELQAMVARDLAGNLPALVARQLLDDVDGAGGDGVGADAEERRDGATAFAATALHGLLTRMLATWDLGSASWLLGELGNHPAVTEATRARLLAAAVAQCDGDWLAARIDRSSHEEMLALAAFVLQLGDEVAERFVERTASTHEALSRWLADLLGTRR